MYQVLLVVTVFLSAGCPRFNSSVRFYAVIRRNCRLTGRKSTDCMGSFTHSTYMTATHRLLIVLILRTLRNSANDDVKVGLGVNGANLSYHWVRGRVHPGEVNSPSHSTLASRVNLDSSIDLKCVLFDYGKETGVQTPQKGSTAYSENSVIFLLLCRM